MAEVVSASITFFSSTVTLFPIFSFSISTFFFRSMACCAILSGCASIMVSSYVMSFAAFRNFMLLSFVSFFMSTIFFMGVASDIMIWNYIRYASTVCFFMHVWPLVSFVFGTHACIFVYGDNWTLIYADISFFFGGDRRTWNGFTIALFRCG